MKLVVRVDDVGYTKNHNNGTFEAIEHGLVTAADVMLDTPGTEDALRRLTEYPWISVGWHIHFWGSPVLPVEDVPSLVAENGHFIPGILNCGEVSYEEAKAELRAELKRCEKILGRIPAYCGTLSGKGPFAKALRDTCEEFDIATDFMTSIIGKEFMPDLPDDARILPASDKWKERDIVCPSVPFVSKLFSNDPEERKQYAPLSLDYFVNDRGNLLEEPEARTIVTIWHPGFIDNYMVFEGEPGDAARLFDYCRVSDVQTLCSTELREWIEKNHIELMNFTDVMYGKKSFQRHLQAEESSLAV